MNIIQTLLLILVVILAFPAGLILARVTKEELKQGRRAFTSIMLASIAVIIVSLFLKFSGEEKTFLAAGMLFLFIISYISFKESYQTIKKGRKSKIKTREIRKKK